jgi:hypothetical protein
MASLLDWGSVMERTAGRERLERVGQFGQATTPGVAAIARRLRSLGPYLFIELLLPGGTLLSLLLFLYRRGGGLDATVSDGSLRPVIVVTRIAAGIRSFWG